MSSRYQKSRPKTKPKYHSSSKNTYYRSQNQSRHLPKTIPSQSAKSRYVNPSRQYVATNNGLGQPPSSHQSHHSSTRPSHRHYNVTQPSSRHHNVQSSSSSSSKYTSRSNHKSSNRSHHKPSYPSQSSARGQSVYSNRTSAHEGSSGHPPLPSDQCSEKPHVQVQHEVNHSTPPNLNLSTYGYSVNARETTRQKALHDAVDKEGVDAVRSRMMFLVDKYVSQPPVVKILIEDYDWMERYNNTNEIRQLFDYQREKTRNKIYQRMQEKSKSRRHHSQRR
jgi:hypothetical protein